MLDALSEVWPSPVLGGGGIDAVSEPLVLLLLASAAELLVPAVDDVLVDALEPELCDELGLGIPPLGRLGLPLELELELELDLELELELELELGDGSDTEGVEVDVDVLVVEQPAASIVTPIVRTSLVSL